MSNENSHKSFFLIVSRFFYIYMYTCYLTGYTLNPCHGGECTIRGWISPECIVKELLSSPSVCQSGECRLSQDRQTVIQVISMTHENSKICTMRLTDRLSWLLDSRREQQCQKEQWCYFFSCVLGHHQLKYLTSVLAPFYTIMVRLL